jgi:hypothetical protein
MDNEKMLSDKNWVPVTREELGWDKPNKETKSSEPWENQYEIVTRDSKGNIIENLDEYLKPPETLGDFTAKMLGVGVKQVQGMANSSTSATVSPRQFRTNQDGEAAMKSHVGGYGLGLILGILAFMLVRPRAKSRTPMDMARRWMSWGLMGGMTTGTTHFFRYGGAEGIAGGLLGICFFSGAAWALGFLFGLIKFSLFPKIFSKAPSVRSVKPAEIPALREAASRGDASARYQLGMAYFAGEGVVKNHIEAYKWILLAQAGGHADAKKMSAQIEKTLSRQELAEGQKLATEIQGNNL